MKKLLFVISLIFAMSLVSVSCFEDLFGRDEEEVVEPSATQLPGYDFTFTCPAGSQNTVPIPKGTAKCQKAYEYFAKVYGCNEADYFNAANRKMCNDCGIANYCTVCK